jgi:hypothetical protein
MAHKIFKEDGEKLEGGTCIVKVPFRRFGIRFWRKQGFTFTLETWRRLSDYTGLSVTEFGHIPRDKFFTVLFLAGAREYNFIQGHYIKFNEDSVMYWIAKVPYEDVNKIFLTMLGSRIGGESINVLIDKYLDIEKKSNRSGGLN